MKAIGLLSVALATLATFAAQAQDESRYPQRAVKIVVNVAPGGGVDAAARVIAQKLGEKGSASVVLLRGHGNVVVGPTIPITVFRAYYTEINARQQLHALALGPHDVVYMDAGECETTDKIMQSVAGRPWELWKARVLGKSPRG